MGARLWSRLALHGEDREQMSGRLAAIASVIKEVVLYEFAIPCTPVCELGN